MSVTYLPTTGYLHPMLLILSLLSCIDSMQQAVGVGSLYSVRCSALMDARGDEYVARCTPATCAVGFTDLGLSQVVVAVDPGVKVLGMAERICAKDLQTQLIGSTPTP